MQIKEHEVFGLNIVLLGNFNPSIMHPQWLVAKGLIRESEAESAVVDVIHPDLCRFEVSWFAIEIRQSRFEIKTLQEQFSEPLKDLVISILRLLGETPIQAYGINYNKHFQLDGAKEYEQFGYRVSPVNELFDFMESPRLLEINVTNLTPENKAANIHNNIKIYPSDIIKSFGVAININTHFIVDGNGKQVSSKIENSWAETIHNSDNMLKKLWSKL